MPTEGLLRLLDESHHPWSDEEQLLETPLPPARVEEEVRVKHPSEGGEHLLPTRVRGGELACEAHQCAQEVTFRQAGVKLLARGREEEGGIAQPAEFGVLQKVGPRSEGEGGRAVVAGPLPLL